MRSTPAILREVGGREFIPMKFRGVAFQFSFSFCRSYPLFQASQSKNKVKWKFLSELSTALVIFFISLVFFFFSQGGVGYKVYCSQVFSFLFPSTNHFSSLHVIHMSFKSVSTINEVQGLFVVDLLNREPPFWGRSITQPIYKSEEFHNDSLIPFTATDIRLLLCTLYVW